MTTLLLLALGAVGPLPDPQMTPGAIRRGVSAADICAKSFSTKSVRPSSRYTNKVKAEQMATLGLKGNPRDFEEDHLISLEIAGDPTAPENLWPQSWKGPCGAHQKDRLENALHRAVCDGRVSLEHAQNAIALNWVDAYHVFVGPLKCEAK